MRNILCICEIKRICSDPQNINKSCTHPVAEPMFSQTCRHLFYAKITIKTFDPVCSVLRIYDNGI